MKVLQMRSENVYSTSLLMVEQFCFIFPEILCIRSEIRTLLWAYWCVNEQYTILRFSPPSIFSLFSNLIDLWPDCSGPSNRQSNGQLWRCLLGGFQPQKHAVALGGANNFLVIFLQYWVVILLTNLWKLLDVARLDQSHRPIALLFLILVNCIPLPCFVNFRVWLFFFLALRMQLLIAVLICNLHCWSLTIAS